MQAERERIVENADNTSDVAEAALTIQRVFRGYRARKAAKQNLKEELLFLGMSPMESNTKNSSRTKMLANMARRRVLRQQYEEEYLQALVDIKEK